MNTKKNTGSGRTDALPTSMCMWIIDEEQVLQRDMGLVWALITMKSSPLSVGMDPPFIGKEESTVPIHECKNRTHSKEFDMLRLVNVSPSKLTGSDCPSY